MVTYSITNASADDAVLSCIVDDVAGPTQDFRDHTLWSSEEQPQQEQENQGENAVEGKVDAGNVEGEWGRPDLFRMEWALPALHRRSDELAQKVSVSTPETAGDTYVDNVA